MPTAKEFIVTTRSMHPQGGQPVDRWLMRVYNYIGAHTIALRGENERDRCRQRSMMTTVGITWLFVFHLIAGTSVSSAEQFWMWGGVVYIVVATSFLVYLKEHPNAGLHLQYAFFAVDPIFISWGLYASPELLSWFLVVLVVTIMRVGYRYGLNAMRAELVVSWIGVAVPLAFGAFWHVQLQMSASLLMTVAWSFWLFAPLIRSTEKAKAIALEREREKILLETLEETLQAKSEFLSRVSHELRSPLQSVISALDVVEERFVRGPDEAELLAKVRRGATALNAQVRDLLTLARGDVGKMEINAVPFEVGELAVTIANEVRAEADAKGLELVVERPIEPIFVVADPARIDQVLTNLLTNAVRHTDTGQVKLKLDPYDATIASLRFEISDSGPGIQEDRIPTLFDPYTRFGELTTKGDGAGLGLAIVRSVLRFLDGKVTVDTQAGRGTTFTVTIPAELLDDEQMVAPEKQSDRVLVVDDRKEVLEAIASVVEQLGFECDTALSAATAANLLGARAYGTVFLDLDMPLKNGFDVAGEARRGDGPNSHTRIVSISAANVPDERRGWPFDAHLTKPITMQAIQRAIAQPELPSDPSRQGAAAKDS
jgi:signal transduction histidine kinase/CheY-like chemotaxis protein